MVKNRLTHTMEVCRKKIKDACHSFEDVKNKVWKLYGEIDFFNGKINDCRKRLSRMGCFKRIICAPIIDFEVTALEIAKCVIYASIAIAEAALTVAQASVHFAQTLGKGALDLVCGVIDSVTSLFFIRKQEATVSADINEFYMQLGIEIVTLSKEYSYSWSIKKEL